MGSEEDKIISGPEFQVPVPTCSLGEFLIPRMKSQQKGNVIQVDSETGASETIEEFLKQCLGIAEGLLNIGLQESDVVAFVGKNRSEMYSAVMGTIFAGGIAAPVDPAMNAHELQRTFKLRRPKYVFTEDETLENVEKALDLLKSQAEVILFECQKEGKTFYKTFAKLTADVDVEAYKPKIIKSPSTQTAVIMPSSGTTGFPKGIALTHQNLIHQLATWEFAKPYCEMPFLHLSHVWIAGIFTSLLSLATGMKRIYIKTLNIENILKAIQNYKPKWTQIAPLVLASLLNHPNLKKYDLSSLKLIEIAGAPITKFLTNRIKEEWDEQIIVRHSYGITELSGMLAEGKVDSAAETFTVGKIGPGIKLKVVDITTKKSLGPNEVGEIYIKYKGMMKCYIDNPEATAECIDNDGWFHTDDRGYYDDDGYLYIMDRIKEMIDVRNQKVSPAELERLIETFPGVAAVGVVGIPNQEDKHHLMALIVKREGFSVTECNILRLVQENLSDYKHLKAGVKFVHSIPKTPSGKIKRTLLKELANSNHKNGNF